MASVTFTLPTPIPASRVQAELTLVDPSGPMHVVLPITNPQAAFKQLEGQWQEIARPGQKPIVNRSASKATMLDLKVTVAAPDGGRLDLGDTVEAVLKNLVSIAQSDDVTTPVALTWGNFDSSPYVTGSGLWHIHTLDVDSEYRQPGSNNISRATVNLTLIEAVNGPSTVGTPTPAWAKPPAAPSAVSAPAPAEWVVTGADTAYSIATAVYGTPEPGWRTILDANGITNPANLTPGMILTIPPAP